MAVKRALISVSDKTGLVDFVRDLVGLGVKIISTGGTSKALKENGLPVSDISEITGFPEMLDGRVKTLHPVIHGGLLFLRNSPEHQATVKKHGIEPIDLVVVNLYPFAKTVAKPGVQLHEAIENIDIGGPSMIRSASKNYQSVGVIVDPADYGAVLEELKKNGELPAELKLKLAVKAFGHTASYDALIYDYLRRQQKEVELLPDKVILPLEKIQQLRYGENPHQPAAYYSLKRAGKTADPWQQLQGKELSFNNLVDLEAAWQIAKSFTEPTVAIIKHTNPCGTASAQDIATAYQKAFEADKVSAYGGIVGANREIDGKTAQAMKELFLEAVIAPGYSAEALDILKEKKNLRLVTYQPAADEPFDYKKIAPGFLIQEVDRADLNENELKVVTKKAPTAKELEDLRFAWKVVKYVKSNAILIAKDKQTLGVGAGQMNRVGSVEISLKQAGAGARGAVLASDAYFPFKDSVELAQAAGISAIIQPGGSIRDAESIETCDKYGLAMVFTGIRHFKH